MTAEVAVDATGVVTQVELWQDADSDSCLVRFGRPHPDDPRGLPTRFDVSRGNEVFGAFIVEPAPPAPGAQP